MLPHRQSNDTERRDEAGGCSRAGDDEPWLYTKVSVQPPSHGSLGCYGQSVEAFLCPSSCPLHSGRR